MNERSGSESVQGVGGLNIDEIIDKQVEKYKSYFPSPVFEKLFGTLKDISHYVDKRIDSIKSDIKFTKYQINTDLSNQALIAKKIDGMQGQLSETNNKAEKTYRLVDDLTRFVIFSTYSAQVDRDINFFMTELLTKMVLSSDRTMADRVVNEVVSPAIDKLKDKLDRFDILNMKFVYISNPKKKEQTLEALNHLMDKIDESRQEIKTAISKKDISMIKKTTEHPRR